MKTILQFIVIAIFCSMVSFAQRGDGHGQGMGPRGAMKKIQELEKVKLIESLDMNEETSVKFFARRNQHQKEMQELEDKTDKILNDMEEELKKSKDENQAKLKKLTEDFINVSNDLHKSRNDFILAQKDILTTEQISRLIVFERNFREEMRKLLVRQRNKK